MAMFDLTKTKTEYGRFLTKALFYELSYDNLDSVLFTLKEHDVTLPNGAHAVSISQKFIELATDDPTEYTFAQHMFGSWEVWERISNAPQLKKHVAKWRNEASVKRKSLAFKSIVMDVVEGGRSAQASAKYLIDEPWVSGKGKDGRAARKEVRETAAEAFERSAVSDDLKRLKQEGLIQ